jgi:hypothetical protein
MLKFVVILFPLCISSFVASTQNTLPELANGPKHSVSAEIGKSPLIGNIVFSKNFRNYKRGMRAYIGFNIAKYRPVFTIGAGTYFLAGSKRHYLEVGPDIGYIKVGEIKDPSYDGNAFFPDSEMNGYILNFNLGYRLITKRQIFRIGISPTLVNEEMFFGGYLSAGIRF